MTFNFYFLFVRLHNLAIEQFKMKSLKRQTTGYQDIEMINYILSMKIHINNSQNCSYFLANNILNYQSSFFMYISNSLPF